MRLAVAVPRIREDMRDNIEVVLQYIDQAADNGAELLLFPETVLTGLMLTDRYDHDIRFALDCDSEEIMRLAQRSAEKRIWVGLGFLEKDRGVMYDTAVLIDAAGQVALKYRRMSAGWCARDADPREYGYGDTFGTAQTPWGRVGFLLCGDLFQFPLDLARQADLDILLFPFARCFSSKIQNPQEEWDQNEWLEYHKRVREIAAVTLMSNYIAPRELNGGGFGGGFIVGKSGRLLASLLLDTPGLLVYDLP